VLLALGSVIIIGLIIVLIGQRGNKTKEFDD
jgi:hypothetical protein